MQFTAKTTTTTSQKSQGLSSKPEDFNQFQEFMKFMEMKRLYETQTSSNSATEDKNPEAKEPEKIDGPNCRKQNVTKDGKENKAP